jgi:colanic acid/amylovoran biosynthesis glycosyltransferase
MVKQRFLSCEHAEVPLVAHFHGWDAYTEYNIATYGESYKQLFNQAAAVIAASKHMRNQLISLGANPDNTFHNACGANISKDVKAFPAKADKQFVMIGRLTEKKAPMCSIEAFSKLLEEHSDARLEIIGNGPLRDNCEQLCNRLGITKEVNVRGAQPHAVVMAALGNARYFIQHYVRAADGDHEGTPVGVIEAMGMGLPVVATRTELWTLSRTKRLVHWLMNTI